MIAPFTGRTGVVKSALATTTRRSKWDATSHIAVAFRSRGATFTIFQRPKGFGSLTSSVILDRAGTSSSARRTAPGVWAATSTSGSVTDPVP